MRTITARLAGLAAIIFTFAGILTAAAAPVAASPGHVAARLSSCSGPVARPSSYDPICNDGAGTIVKLHWSSWGSTASGRGEFFSRRCALDCPVSVIVVYQVAVSAWRVEDGMYTRLEYHFTGRVPNGLPRAWVLSFYNGRWHGRTV
jgi:hypothetical protein